MRATYEALVSILSGLLTVMMGIKSQTLSLIDLDSFWFTILSACNLGRDDASLEGHMLTEYKLDSRIKSLIPPRGVYISSDRFARDLMSHDEGGVDPWEYKKLNSEGKSVDVKTRILSPSEFSEVQANLIGAMRKSVEFNTTLEECIKEVELASVAQRTVSNGKCHYSDIPYLPIPCSVTLFNDLVWYNLPVEDMLKELSVSVLKQFR